MTVNGTKIEGEGTTINGRRFGALLLALRARDGEPMVQSLIVPAVEYQPVKRYRIGMLVLGYWISPTNLFEGLGGCYPAFACAWVYWCPSGCFAETRIAYTQRPRQ